MGLGLRFLTLEVAVLAEVFLDSAIEGGVGVFFSAGRRLASSFTGLFDVGVLYSLSSEIFFAAESLFDFFILFSGLVMELFADLKLLKLLLLVVDGILFNDCDGGMRATGAAAIGLIYPLEVVLAFDWFWYSSSTGVFTFE